MAKINDHVRNHILALFFISLGGWLLHLRGHPIDGNPANYIPFIFGVLNVFFVPVLFSFKKTSIIAYLINGFSVIIGVIVMARFSLSGLPYPVIFSSVVLKTTLPFIFILIPKLLLGQIILKQYYPSGLGRMFTTVWWVKHSCYVTIVYILGFYLWR